MMRIPLSVSAPSLTPHVRVLLVQDRRGSVQHIREHAEMNDHRYRIELRHTASGAKAVELAKSWEPSIIVVDAFLSDTNSFELLEQIKDHHMPVVITGPDPSAEIEQSARDHGAAAYLSSSEDPDTLEELLRELVRLAETKLLEQ